jgi:hypothetical protein
MEDNSAFYITPPTIFMPKSGMRFSLLGTDEDWIHETSEALEKAFTTQLTIYHIEGNESTETIAWQLLYLGYSDVALVDSSALTLAQSMMALSCREATVWWHVTDTTDPAMRMLLTAADVHTYSDIEDFIETLKG